MMFWKKCQSRVDSVYVCVYVCMLARVNARMHTCCIFRDSSVLDCL